MDVTELETTKDKFNSYENCINTLPIARAYIPPQRYTLTYPVIQGLKEGTIFPELNIPYRKPDKNYKPKRAC